MTLRTCLAARPWTRSFGPLRLLAAILIAGVGGCYKVDTPEFVEGFEVAGTVSGMWDGAAVTLRLETSDGDEFVTVAGNNSFAFGGLLIDGESFAVTLETSPIAHTCTVVDGSGVITGDDYGRVGVTCAGPAVEVTVSASVDWSFDPDQTSHEIPVSVLVEELNLAVLSDDATLINIAGVETQSGEYSPAQVLSIGQNSFSVSVQVESLSRSYELNFDRGGSVIAQHVYVKPSDVDGFDFFGGTMALDGDTLVVGSPNEDSSTRTINGQEDEARVESGAAYVFRRTDGVWQQEAFLKANNADANDSFGSSVSVSGDTVIVGARGEDGPANGVQDSGAAYVFVRSGTQWQQQAYLRASDLVGAENFGGHVAVSGDVIAVGEVGDGNAAYVFRRTGPTWSQEGNRIAPFADPFATTCVAVDGDVLAVGSPFGGGVVHVYRWNGTGWSSEDTLEAVIGDSTNRFGSALSVRDDTIVVGDSLESSSGRGIDPADVDATAAASGAVYVFERSGVAWTQTAFIKSSNSESGDGFGISVSVSRDVLIVGAATERGAGAGPGSDQTSNAAPGSGAAYVFRRDGDTWVQSEYLKASNTDPGDQFGFAVAAGRDSVAVGAHFEASDATGIDGGQGNSPGFEQAGAAYVFR